eukprot:gnl/MRDRNA2_/MRDRNA2_190293_c0_seq1.p1 gnl/MRDRNA2_/MRDRNA2_190293_c0~~gnl/MRDRNA2_/MRDRNA2_190293_c0_seq1.p1  ORF type:complete len:447 (-),score=90.77 gnl/MRDRNA2_/MRDRNA2_190293_c0_seq1:68-1387(-)
MESVPDVGVALSAGGSTGLLAGLCDLHELVNLTAQVGRPMESVMISAASGGTLATLLNANIGTEGLAFPPSLEPQELSLSKLNSTSTGKSGEPWWGSILKQIPQKLDWQVVLEGLIAAGKGRHWFMEGLLEAATKAYGQTNWTNAGSAPFYAQVSVIDSDSLPFSVDPHDGMTPLKNATKKLWPGEVDMSTGDLRIFGAETAFAGRLSIDEAAAASSFFPAAGILADTWDSRLKLKLKELLLMKTTVQSPGGKASQDVYLADGGLVEPTGVATLLRRQVKRIVVFINCPEGLHRTKAILSFLFGSSGNTDIGNVLPGADLLQVFPKSLWAEVDTRLTGENVIAHLENVKVIDNSYLGVKACKLEELVIFSNERSDKFLDLFPEPAGLRAVIDDYWPLGIAMGMSPIEANLLCAYQHWKVSSNADVLKRIFRTTETNIVV